MTEKEYNQCVDLYADNVYRFILKNLRHEEDARDVVHRLLEDAGAIVATAGSTAEALTARRMIARTCS